MARTLPLAQRTITCYSNGHPTAVVTAPSRAAALRTFEAGLVYTGGYTASEQHDMVNALNAGKPVTTTLNGRETTHHLPDRYLSHDAPTPENPRGERATTTKIVTAPTEDGQYTEWVDTVGRHAFVEQTWTPGAGHISLIDEWIYSEATGQWKKHATRIEGGIPTSNTFEVDAEEAHEEIALLREQYRVDVTDLPDHS